MKNLIAMRFLVAWSGKIPKVLMLAVMVILAMPHFASPATFTVNRTDDAVDAIPGDGVCETASGNGVCTLRAAVQETNALAGRDVINLPAGMYKLTIHGKGENAAATGDLNITDSLGIIGEDASNTIIDGDVCDDPNAPTCTSESVRSDDDRVMSILNLDGTNPIVNISGVTIQNGGGSSVAGGGIRIFAGSSLSLTNCIVRENKSRQFGGGISNEGFLQIFQSTISDNTLPIGTLGGETSSGGGIFNSGNGSIEIDQSTISGNEAARGGGIRNAGGRLEITNSTISGNRATARGGGIMNFGTADIAFSTITGNEANRPISVIGSEDRFGGGIYNVAAVSTAGVPSTVSLGNTILAGNTDNRSRFQPEFSPDCFSRDPGSFTSFRGNLVGIVNQNCNMQDTIFGDTRFDQVGPVPCPIPGVPDRMCPLDPLLGPLANNGGSTQTHALLSSSPAIDQGTGVTSATFFDCPETDQRGLTRPVDGDRDGTAACDIGAFEFGAIPPEIVNSQVSLASKPLTSFSTIPTPNGPAGTFFITATFTNTSTIPIRKPFFQVVELSGGNVLINADLGPGGVGAILTPDVGPDRLLTPGESVTAEFRIGLQTLNPFTFLVDVMGEPIQ